jgi:hypothetical protein
VFENRVLRRIFGPKRDEVAGEWRKLHNEELGVWYSSPNIIKTILRGLNPRANYTDRETAAIQRS